MVILSERERQLTPAATPRLSVTERLIGRVRKMFYGALALTAFGTTACSEVGDPPQRGSVCISVLDNQDQAMAAGSCNFSYDKNAEKALRDEDEAYAEEYCDENGQANPDQFVYDENACSGEGQILHVYSTPGKHILSATCDNGQDKTTGTIEVNVEKSAITEHTSRLIDSFCPMNYQYSTGYQKPPIVFNEELGWNNDTWCTTKLSIPELFGTKIVDYELDCGNDPNCDPTVGRDYLQEQGTPGQMSDGQPIHLTVSQTTLVPPETKQTVVVSFKYTGNPTQNDTAQLIKIPVEINGATCGNGAIEPGETCEGMDFNDKGCKNYGPLYGELVCNDCQTSTENCTDEPPAE